MRSKQLHSAKGLRNHTTDGHITHRELLTLGPEWVKQEAVTQRDVRREELRMAVLLAL